MPFKLSNGRIGIAKNQNKMVQLQLYFESTNKFSGKIAFVKRELIWLHTSTSFLETGAIETTDVKLEEAIKPADHPVAQKFIPTAGNNFSLNTDYLNNRYFISNSNLIKQNVAP